MPAANHFHQRHLPDRVEEVQAAESLGVFQAFGQLRDRDRGRVRAKNGVVRHEWLEPRVQMLLRLGLFDDRFDDDVGVAQLDVGKRAVDERRELDGPLHVRAFDLLVVGDFVQHTLNAAGECGLIGIHERDGDVRV